MSRPPPARDPGFEPSVPPPRATRGRLGRYELCFELGSGGMATVFLARVQGPPGFDKLVALKRIHKHLAQDDRYVDMFFDEARIASRISHANVCSVFDFGVVDGEYYIAMDYLEGENLAQVMRRFVSTRGAVDTPLYPSMVAKIIADACEGLHAAHEIRDETGAPMNVVHRDVSPHNMLVTYNGVTIVMDFGIAHAAHRLQETATGEIKGKLAYMAPEQVRGATVDRRADIWALGVVLWELLAVRRLFHREDSASILNAVIHDPMVAPSSIRPTVPSELDRIVLRALTRDPTERYATAREMGRDLVRFMGKEFEPVGPADVAAWMERLFADRVEARRQLAAAARSMAVLTTPAPPRVEGMEEDPKTAADEGVAEYGRNATASTRSARKLAGDAEALDLRATEAFTPSASRRRADLLGAAKDGLLSEGSGVLTRSTPAKALPTPPGVVPFGAETPVLPRDEGVPLRRSRWALLALGAAVTGAIVVLLATSGGLTSGGLLPAGDGASGRSTPAPSAPPSSVQAVPRPEGLAPSPPVARPAPDASPTQVLAPPVESPAGADTRRPPRTKLPEPGGADPGHPVAAVATGGDLGTLTLITQGGWAEVHDERGRTLGTTPLRVQLPAGRHTLSLLPGGQPPAKRVTVVVPAGGSERTTVDL